MKTLNQILFEADNRSKWQKLKDMRDHPNTEPNMKIAAQRAMDKIGEPKLDPSKFGKWSDKVSQEPFDVRDTPKPKTSYPGQDKAYGFYRYNSRQKTYHGPFEGEGGASGRASGKPFDADDRVVLHSGQTKRWRERSHKDKYGDQHDFDTEATFPQKKKRMYPDD